MLKISSVPTWGRIQFDVIKLDMKLVLTCLKMIVAGERLSILRGGGIRVGSASDTDTQ